MRLIKSALLASTLLSSSVIAAQAEINVVASIKPVHSLVAAVMEGVGEPELIVQGAGSPHTYALKPSQAKILENADLVFWVGQEIEAFLEKPLSAIATKAKKVELIDSHDLIKLELREGGAFDAHDHEGHGDGEHDDHDHDKHAEDKHDDHDHDKHAEGEHDHHDHDKHAEDNHDDHDHDKHAEDKHDDHNHAKHAEGDHDDHDHDKHAEADHDDHEHGEFDAHVWLDPVNAKVLVEEIAEGLVATDPANATKYEANAKAVSAKLDALVDEVTNQLTPVKGKGFVVFHDAYQNFEKRFGLSAVGSITVSPEVLPGAERIGELRSKVKGLDAACVFSEPQFEPRLVATVTEGTNAKTGVLDPLGASLDDGPELYFTLIREMAQSFKNCLSESS